MKLIKRMTLAATIGATMAFPAAVMAADTTQGVISFDHGSLDTLDTLGLNDHILAVPKQSLPDYLAHYAGDEYPDAGGLKSPDLETIAKLQPDLVLITSRQGDLLDQLSNDITVVDVGLPEGSFAEGVTEQVLNLASRFGSSEKARTALEELWDYVAKQKRRIEGEPEVLVVTHNDGKYSLRSEPTVTELLGLGLPEVPKGTETITRGARTFTPLTPEVMAVLAPDIILVVDRSAAIGSTPLNAIQLSERLAELGAADSQVTILSPGLWYLSGGGLRSIRLQVDEVLASMDPPTES